MRKGKRGKSNGNRKLVVSAVEKAKKEKLVPYHLFSVLQVKIENFIPINFFFKELFENAINFAVFTYCAVREYRKIW